MKLSELFESTDQPFIWQLAQAQLLNGKKIGFHAHLPGSSTFVTGWLERVSPTGFNVWIDDQRASRAFGFGKHDDDNLTIRPSSNLDVADLMIVDME